MDQWKKDARKEAVITDIDTLVPADHLLRKIERVMDYDRLYERLEPYYNHEVGRPSIDPVVLIKMVLLQHLFGIPSLRQTYREIHVNIAYTTRQMTHTPVRMAAYSGIRPQIRTEGEATEARRSTA